MESAPTLRFIKIQTVQRNLDRYLPVRLDTVLKLNIPIDLRQWHLTTNGFDIDGLPDIVIVLVVCLFESGWPT